MGDGQVASGVYSHDDPNLFWLRVIKQTEAWREELLPQTLQSMEQDPDKLGLGGGLIWVPPSAFRTFLPTKFCFVLVMRGGGMEIHKGEHSE